MRIYYAHWNVHPVNPCVLLRIPRHQKNPQI